jgi:hypothetical protein
VNHPICGDCLARAVGQDRELETELLDHPAVVLDPVDGDGDHLGPACSDFIDA